MKRKIQPYIVTIHKRHRVYYKCNKVTTDLLCLVVIVKQSKHRVCPATPACYSRTLDAEAEGWLVVSLKPSLGYRIKVPSCRKAGKQEREKESYFTQAHTQVTH